MFVVGHDDSLELKTVVDHLLDALISHLSAIQIERVKKRTVVNNSIDACVRCIMLLGKIHELETVIFGNRIDDLLVIDLLRKLNGRVANTNMRHVLKKRVKCLCNVHFSLF